MGDAVCLLVGTTKGAFVLHGDAARETWDLQGPYCETWPINHVIGDPATGRILAGGGNSWLGIGVWQSPDMGASWSWSGEGLGLGEDGPEIDTVWSLGRAGGRLYAGTRPAALFESVDGMQWRHVASLRDHPTRPDWQPGGAGLTLHHIVTHPDDPDRIWVGISSAGVFATEDGGATWEPRNRGTRNDYAEDEAGRYPEFGQCVHGMALAPGTDATLYQQNHCGMYRSTDGGRMWTSIEAGLPSSFGFAVAVHPRDPQTAWLIPMNGDIRGRYVPDAAAAVWRTRDGGQGWQDLRAGLPQTHTYFTVLRQAMAVDRGDPAGVYFGTNSGSLFASTDEGDSWREIARHLPTVLSVETMTTGG